jgi:hypothetical protein
MASAKRQLNARRQPRVGGKFAGPPKPATDDDGPPPPEPTPPPRTGRGRYPKPADVEPPAAPEKDPPEQDDSPPPEPAPRTARRSRSGTARRSTAKPAPRTPPAATAPARRGLLAELADGLAAPFTGRR